jgi:GNAT superfamily N-acetyltransferase
MVASLDHSLDDLTIKPVGAGDWPAFERLFESRGAPKHCWCMAWRASAEERRAFSAAAGSSSGGRAKSSALRKKAMQRRIAGGTTVGLLAYAGDEPVAWCSVAPRPTYRKLGGPEDHSDDANAVWSIACFFVARSWRGHGVTRKLVDAAADYAAAAGAEILEAYPPDADSPSYRFMGAVKMFAEAGFIPVGRAGSRRNVMRRELAGRGSY